MIQSHILGDSIPEISLVAQASEIPVIDSQDLLSLMRRSWKSTIFLLRFLKIVRKKKDKSPESPKEEILTGDSHSYSFFLAAQESFIAAIKNQSNVVQEKEKRQH